ncbi:MAG: energy-coupling factor transporter transmembrane protein EcfT [Bacilli bacterium]|nr:energy-coupling factor transporter transmembrane protein EcfT [Bacilli bacterium]
MNNLTFGRYAPFNTFVHKLDPRNKLLMMILLLVSIFLKVDSWSSTLILTAFLFLLLIAAMIMSRVSFLQLFKSLSMMWFLVIFLLLIYIFIPNPNYNPEHIAFYIGSYAVNYDAFYQSGYIIFRLIMMIMITMILTATTKPMDLTYAIEWYLSPLKIFKYPVAHILAMTLSIALRFIPTLLDETQRIMKAQSSRGVDFNKGGIFKRIGGLVALIIPLFVSAIGRSEELSNAMEARGYNPYAKRSRYRILKFSWRDLIAFISILAIFGGILTLKIYDANFIKIDFIYWIFGAKPLF